MADTQYLKDNLVGFVPSIISDEIIGMAVRGSSVLRLFKVERMESDNKTFSFMLKALARNNFTACLLSLIAPTVGILLRRLPL